MENIIYSIDDFCIFKEIAIISGWCLSESTISMNIIHSNDIHITGELYWMHRPDVIRVHPSAPENCGFVLRTILPHGTDVMTLKLAFWIGKDEVIVERPWDEIVTKTYAPLNAFHQHFFETVKQIAHPRILEIGSRARSGITRKEMFGEHAVYTGLDIVPGENVDVLGDAHQLTQYFEPSSFDFCYSASVFEHLMWPWKVALELNKILKPEGLLLMQSHPIWTKHEVPWDFFRFWDSGWRALFCSTTGFEVIDTIEAHPVSLVARPFTGSYVHYFENQVATLASGVLARKISEPSVTWNAVPDLDAFGRYPG